MNPFQEINFQLYECFKYLYIFVFLFKKKIFLHSVFILEIKKKLGN